MFCCVSVEHSYQLRLCLSHGILEPLMLASSQRHGLWKDAVDIDADFALAEDKIASTTQTPTGSPVSHSYQLSLSLYIQVNLIDENLINFTYLYNLTVLIILLLNRLSPQWDIRLQQCSSTGRDLCCDLSLIPRVPHILELRHLLPCYLWASWLLSSGWRPSY